MPLHYVVLVVVCYFVDVWNNDITTAWRSKYWIIMPPSSFLLVLSDSGVIVHMCICIFIFGHV